MKSDHRLASAILPSTTLILSSSTRDLLNKANSSVHGAFHDEADSKRLRVPKHILRKAGHFSADYERTGGEEENRRSVGPTGEDLSGGLLLMWQSFRLAFFDSLNG